MQNIYIAKPGGQKEGPYTLEQINRNLATQKISDTDFWAWHEGLPAWMPLHSVPGVAAKVGGSAAPDVKPHPGPPKGAPAPINPQVRSEPTTPKPEALPSATKPEPVRLNVEATTAPVITSAKEIPKASAVAEPEPKTPEAEALPVAKSETPAPSIEPKPPETFAAPSMSSGKPFAALEQIFVFTTGDGPSTFKSEITTTMLSEAVGEKSEIIRSKVPVDVIGGADAGVLEAFGDGSIPASAWRALLNIKPDVAQQAREGVYHLCVRTFPVESKELVALFLLYNKQML